HQRIVGRECVSVPRCALPLLSRLIPLDELPDLGSQIAKIVTSRMCNRAVPVFPQARPMHTDDQSRIPVDAGKPIQTPLISLELGCAQRHLQKWIRLSCLGMEERTGFVPQPAVIVESRRAYHGGIRLGCGKRVTSPQGTKLPYQPAMTGLPDQDEFVVALFTYDHGSLRCNNQKSEFPMRILLFLIRKSDFLFAGERGPVGP